MTAHQHTAGDRPYLPPMGRRWLLPLYDPMTRLAGVARVHEELAGRADLRPGQRILEIGCGTGNLLLTVARRRPDAEVIGIDPDRGSVRRAARKARRAGLPVRIERAYADDLPLPDASIDRVLSSFMWHHVGDAEKPAALREIRRVLRPGGELHLVDVSGEHAHRSRHLTGNQEDRVLEALGAAGFGEAAVTGHGRSRLGGYTFYRVLSPVVSSVGDGDDGGRGDGRAGGARGPEDPRGEQPAR